MRLVNLFIVGAAKSGTTSFHDYLNQHPDIEMSSIKEPNYFSSKEIQNDNLYYLDAPLITSNEKYKNLFKSNNRILGESSVSYLFYSHIASKIKIYNPSAKIIIILRNPINRAYSHYLMDHSAGYLKESFSEIIRDPQSHPTAYQQIVDYIMYYDQVKRYIEGFPCGQVKILIMEDMLSDLPGSVENIEKFLAIYKYSDYMFDIKNGYSSTTNLILKPFYTSIRLKSYFKKIISKELIDKLKRVFLNAEKPNISEEDRIFLKSYYKGDVEKLSVLLDVNLNKKWGI